MSPLSIARRKHHVRPMGSRALDLQPLCPGQGARVGTRRWDGLRAPHAQERGGWAGRRGGPAGPSVCLSGQGVIRMPGPLIASACGAGRQPRPNCAPPAPQRPPCRAPGHLIGRQPPPSSSEIMGLHLHVLSAPPHNGEQMRSEGPEWGGLPGTGRRAWISKHANTRTFHERPGALLGRGAHH